MTLLDKTVRDHLLQYMVHVLRRGFAYVYALYPSQWEEKVYHPYICTLKYSLAAMGKCLRDSCLDCRKLPTCTEFRAEYERRKIETQKTRYAQAELDASKLEAKELTTAQLTNIAYDLREKFTDEESKINVKKMRLILLKELRLSISIGRGYDVREMLLFEHPNNFVK